MMISCDPTESLWNHGDIEKSKSKSFSFLPTFNASVAF